MGSGINMRITKMNKKGMSISIVLLVVMTLILVCLAMYYFIISDKNRENLFNAPGGIDPVYTIAGGFNFYLDSAFLKASDGFKFEDGGIRFVERFNNELNNSEFISERFYISYSPIDLASIELTKDKLVLKIDVTILNNETDSLSVKYDYIKIFSRGL